MTDWSLILFDTQSQQTNWLFCFEMSSRNRTIVKRNSPLFPVTLRILDILIHPLINIWYASAIDHSDICPSCHWIYWFNRSRHSKNDSRSSAVKFTQTGRWRIVALWYKIQDLWIDIDKSYLFIGLLNRGKEKRPNEKIRFWKNKLHLRDDEKRQILI